MKAAQATIRCFGHGTIRRKPAEFAAHNDDRSYEEGHPGKARGSTRPHQLSQRRQDYANISDVDKYAQRLKIAAEFLIISISLKKIGLL